MHPVPPITKIYVQEGCEQLAMTRNILRNYPCVTPRVITRGADAYRDLRATAADPIGEGKKRLFIGRQQGAFLKKCPGTRNMLCCNYYILNLATQCSLNCSYCILQEYFQNNPVLKIFCNIRDSFKELDALSRSRPGGTFRIGTGEYTDSLALDEIAGFSTELIPFFMKRKNLILELKTKTTKIANLLQYQDADNVVVAWSLNPDPVVEQEEEGAAKVRERLEAASVCARRGYKIAFHFDPLILYQGWAGDYQKTVEEIFQWVDPQDIAWISLGTLRFRTGLKEIVRERFPESALLKGEFVPCADGKMRYLKSRRVEAYRKMTAWIKAHAPGPRVYLCMESREVWQRVFHRVPRCQKNLDLLFDDGC